MGLDMNCYYEGCDRPHYARGSCKKHYFRIQRGQVDTGVRLRRPNGEHQDFLLNTVVPYQGDDCLLWPYSKYRDGRATIYLNGKMQIASRIVCQEAHGNPPTDKHQAAHLCGNGHLACVNPRHLAWKTMTENHADKLKHGTSNRNVHSGGFKLSPDDVRTIRELAATVRQKDLAKRYGVDPSHINKIIKNRVCQHC